MKSRVASFALLNALAAANCLPADRSVLALPAPKKEGIVSVEAALASGAPCAPIRSRL